MTTHNFTLSFFIACVQHMQPFQKSKNFARFLPVSSMQRVLIYTTSSILRGMVNPSMPDSLVPKMVEVGAILYPPPERYKR
jgi:hypothetical protein